MISEFFTALVEAIDAELALAAAAAFGAGLARGFAGFGAAMIFVPATGAIYDPRLAVPVLYLIDLVTQVPLVAANARHADRRAIVFLAAGALVGVPLGVWLLKVLPAEIMRWGISLIVLALVAVLASGWRRLQPPGRALSVGVGSASGVLGGLAGLTGPPIIVFWLTGTEKPRQVRANIILFFAVTTALAGVSMIVADLFTAEVFVTSVWLLPAFAAGAGLGAHFFRAANELLYRRVAFALIALVAIATLPVMDRLF